MSRFSQMLNTPVPSYKPYEDPDTMLDSGMAGNIFSGAMNAIDIPGSMVRDAISFSNPFDQLATPFSDKNRTTGAQISKYWAGGNEDSGGNQLAGMVIDILTDPLMIATGGTAAAGRLGAKAASTAYKGAKGVGKAAKSSMVQAGANQARRQLPEIVAANKSAADNLATQAAQSPFGQFYKQGVIDDLAGRPSREMIENSMASLPRSQQVLNRAQAIGSGAMAGARQLGQSMYGGVTGGLRNAVGESMALAGRGLGAGTGAAKPLRQRDALGQLYAIGTNAMQTATGQRMPQEQSMEDMIAQALMEDPQLMEELLMAMGGDQSGY